MRCPNCGTNNPPEEQLTYCKKCGAELRTICPRCNADNPSDAEHCSDCGLELHPDRGHERIAGIRVEPDTDFIPAVLKKRPTLSTGMLGVALGVLVIVWIPIFLTLKKRAQFTGCQSNLKNLAMAMQAYAQDNEGHAPTADDWPTLLLRYVPDRKALECPSRPGHIGYAFNLGMSEAPLSHLNNSGSLIAFFETGDEKNLSGTQLMWLNPPAHSRGNNVVFADGTVRQALKAPIDQFWQAKVATLPQPAPVDQTTTPVNPSANPPVNPLKPGETAEPPRAPTSSQDAAATGAAPTSAAPNPPPPGGNPPPPDAGSATFPPPVS